MTPIEEARKALEEGMRDHLHCSGEHCSVKRTYEKSLAALSRAEQPVAEEIVRREDVMREDFEAHLRRGEERRAGIEKAKKALLDWHARLLAEAYRPQSFFMLQSWDAQRLVDDLLDAALSIEQQCRTADAAITALKARPADEVLSRAPAPEAADAWPVLEPPTDDERGPDVPYDVEKWLATIEAHCTCIADDPVTKHQQELLNCIRWNIADVREAVAGAVGADQPAAPGWRSMDGAPKDGTKIDLLFAEPRGRTINCFWLQNEFTGPDGGWFWRTPAFAETGEVLPEEDWFLSCYPNMTPTHWRLPPAPPAEPEEAK